MQALEQMGRQDELKAVWFFQEEKEKVGPNLRERRCFK